MAAAILNSSCVLTRITFWFYNSVCVFTMSVNNVCIVGCLWHLWPALCYASCHSPCDLANKYDCWSLSNGLRPAMLLCNRRNTRRLTSHLTIYPSRQSLKWHIDRSVHHCGWTSTIRSSLVTQLSFDCGDNPTDHDTVEFQQSLMEMLQEIASSISPIIYHTD